MDVNAMEAFIEALAKKVEKGLRSKPIVSKIKVNTAFLTDNAKPLYAFFLSTLDFMSPINNMR